MFGLMPQPLKKDKNKGEMHLGTFPRASQVPEHALDAPFRGESYRRRRKMKRRPRTSTPLPDSESSSSSSSDSSSGAVDEFFYQSWRRELEKERSIQPRYNDRCSPILQNCQFYIIPYNYQPATCSCLMTYIYLYPWNTRMEYCSLIAYSPAFCFGTDVHYGILPNPWYCCYT